MVASLLIQVLGNSDVLLGTGKGVESLKGNDLEVVQYYSETIAQDIKDGLETIDFPLIRQFKDAYRESDRLYFAIILTDQRDWIEKQNIMGEQWNQIIASDGIWWQDLLQEWCKQHEIEVYPIILKIDADIQNGAADWDGMAFLIENCLSQHIHKPNKKTIFSPDSVGKEIEIDRVIVQHNSGTPALGSALYLWGIERKLAGLPIEFFYISRQEEGGVKHSGDRWQWRLKVPQIEQLLAIQDFNGVLTLLDKNKKDLLKKVRHLDRAVSLNIKGLGLQPREKIIERIAISLWSEIAFRERGQWMHWYLRVAGAFELAIYCLVERQGNGDYQWVSDNTGKTSLEYTKNVTDPDFRLNISPTVKYLLGRGDYLDHRDNRYVVTPIAPSTEWRNFVDFYCENGWRLSAGNSYSFLSLRNDLYHSLQGETIDEILDQKNKEFGNATDSKHPAEIAIGHLRYIIDLAEIKSEVFERVDHYEEMVQEFKKSLKEFIA